MNNSPIPSKNEIRRLPCWAIVAFAARCARRVQPLFGNAASDKHLNSVERAISIAERFATDGTSIFSYPTAFADADVAAGDAAGAAVETAKATAATTMADAARAAAEAAATAKAAAAGNSADNMAIAAHAAAYAAAKATSPNGGIWFRVDFDLLARKCREFKWTDKTPVPPSVFGPIWPEGLPKGWPRAETPQPVQNLKQANAEKRRQVLVLSASLPETFDEGKVTDELVGVYKLLNDYQLATGGPGLSIDEFKRLVPVLKPQEVLT